MRLSSIVRWMAPAAALATSGCLATQNDLRVLQADLASYRSESARADSAQRLQLEQILASVRGVDDTLRVASARLGKLQSDASQSAYSTNEQLLQIQELTGQSQRRLQELRASLEQRAVPGAAPAAAPAGLSAPGTVGAPGTTAPPPVGTAPAATAPAAPGPNQLYQLSLDQLRRGSNAAARTGFLDLLRQYPASDVAGEAQFYVAESYAAENSRAAADSAYVLTYMKYPTTSRAATALYKHALALDGAGRAADARAALDEVVKRYPRSDEAELARERLRAER